ncbi:MAG: LacI family DNA-binding transcriptional regulator [Phycisphaerae bacterium]|nr:LacI family DNA-binding transcriptional regulator [Phycisphaerae bacterium]
MVRLKDIAEQLHLDVSVVSRALNPRPDRHAVLAEETMRRVRETARRMGYRRNRVAEFLRRGQSATLGMFLPESSNRLVADLMCGLGKQASESGFPLNFFFGETQSRFETFLKESTGASRTGIITYPYNPSLQDRLGSMIAEYRHRGGKVVVMNALIDYPGIPGIRIDETRGGQLAAEHLLSKDCRAYLYESSVLPGRGVAFAETIRTHGGSLFAFVKGNLQTALQRGMKESSQRPLGLFFPTDYQAVEALSVLEQMNVKVGRDVLLVGYDDLTLTDRLPTPLTTIRQPFQELGRRAVQKLVNLIYGNEEANETIAPRLIARASTEGS